MGVFVAAGGGEGIVFPGIRHAIGRTGELRLQLAAASTRGILLVGLADRQTEERSGTGRNYRWHRAYRAPVPDRPVGAQAGTSLAPYPQRRLLVPRSRTEVMDCGFVPIAAGRVSPASDSNAAVGAIHRTVGAGS